MEGNKYNISIDLEKLTADSISLAEKIEAIRGTEEMFLSILTEYYALKLGQSISNKDYGKQNELVGLLDLAGTIRGILNNNNNKE